MNANELADELDKCWKYDGELFEKAATMLRQLQAENEALKRPNNVVGVPQDKLTDMQVTIRQLQAENEALKAELKLIDELVRGKK